MYEQFRISMLTQLQDRTLFTSEEIKNILNLLDVVAEDYTIERSCTDLVAYAAEGYPEPVRDYIAVKTIEGCSPGTLKLYTNQLKIFFRHMRKPLHEITTNDIRMFLYLYKQSHDISDRSLEKMRTIIRGCFKWMHNEKYIAEDPSFNVQPIKFEVKPRQALNQLELENVRRTVTKVNTKAKTPLMELRDKAILEFMYSTGCRVGELVILKKSDIDWGTKTVHLFGKGKKHRFSFINAKAELALKEYFEARTDDSDVVFASTKEPYGQLSIGTVEKRVRLWRVNTPELEKVLTPHVFRHTTATVALQNGMPIENVSHLLGHSKISTTQIYAETSENNVQTDHKKYVI